VGAGLQFLDTTHGIRRYACGSSLSTPRCVSASRWRCTSPTA